MLETEADVSTFVIVAMHMLLLCQFILTLDMGHIEDYTYEQQLRIVNKL